MSLPFDSLGVIVGKLSSSDDPALAEMGRELHLVCEEAADLDTLLNAVFYRSPMPLVYSRALKVKRVNTAFCELMGYSEAELLEQTIPLAVLQPEGCPSQFPDLGEVFSSMQTLLCEVSLQAKSGRVITALVRALPFRLASGETANISFVQETAGKREVERLLMRDSLVVGRSPLVIFEGRWRGEKFIIHDVSENISQFLYSAHDVVNRELDIISLVHEEDRPRLLESLSRDNLEEKLEREYQLRLRDGQGQYRWVSLRDRIVPGAGPGGETVAGVLLDITKRKEAEMALEKSNAHLEQQVALLEKTWEQTIHLLAGVTELRDPYTMGHQRRVADLAGALAREMGLPEEQVQELIRAGLVHDIGKIQIPAEFLSKPGKLAEREFAIIREHPSIGSNLLKNIELPWPLSDIVLQHHERMNGSGYPQGLKGDEILPAARIIAVADVVEAMASYRPYRPALGVGKALAEVTDNAGRLYDVEVVEACRRLFLEKGYCLPAL